MADRLWIEGNGMIIRKTVFIKEVITSDEMG
ncbi:MAG: hypothetical protein ACJASZ_001919 [Yoonia sp.]